MHPELKKIIDSYPKFSRETIFNIVNEFNAKTLKKKKKQSKKKILESFMVSENNKIYFYEKTSERCKMLIIGQKENNAIVRYRDFFDEEKNTEWNFSKVLDNFEEESKWDSIIDIELSEKIKEINLKFEFYNYFCIRKGFLEYFLFKNIMLFLSEESLVALDFVKALKEVEKYNVNIMLLWKCRICYFKKKIFFNMELCFLC